MTEVLDRDLASAPEARSPARPQAAGPPGTTREDSGSNSPYRESCSQADEAVVDMLRRCDFAGPKFEMFLYQLVGYALPVMRKLLRTGEIFEQTARYGRSIARPDWFTADNADDLVAETIAEGVNLFRSQLMQDAWKPGGASLRTFFIGACIRSFPNVFRRFERSHSKWISHNLAVDSEEYESLLSTLANRSFDDLTTRSAEETVLAQQSICSAIADLSWPKQKLVFLVAHEVSQDEIAKELGISTRAVEGRLRRAREELREILASKTRRWSVAKARDYDVCLASRH